jgi:hypothetical protein
MPGVIASIEAAIGRLTPRKRGRGRCFIHAHYPHRVICFVGSESFRISLCRHATVLFDFGGAEHTPTAAHELDPTKHETDSPMNEHAANQRALVVYALLIRIFMMLHPIDRDSEHTNRVSYIFFDSRGVSTE